MNENMALTLNSSVFEEFKAAFDVVLNRMIVTMQEQGSSEGVLTAKMTVNLDRVDEDTAIPSVKHEVSSTIAVKDKASGRLVGQYVMVKDEATGAYMIREMESDQTSCFDPDPDSVEE